MQLPFITPEAVSQQSTFEKIASDILEQGYSINHCGLPEEITTLLQAHSITMPETLFEKAGIGRESDFEHDESVRGDEICWISGNSLAGQHWLTWCESLKQYLNRRLYLGLFSFESHFAHYPPGAFYQRHVDAFHGDKNRVLSMVLYLNQHWQESDGGELVLYQDKDDITGIKVKPEFGTLVLFLSEQFPHEVLAANRDRLSIAGWFRVNCSNEQKVDPPR